MIEVNWDLAPEGVDRLVESVSWGYLRWGNSLGQYWGSNSWFNSDEEYKTISARPTQTKTVSDAVEYFKGVWPKFLNLDDSDCYWFHGDGHLVWAYESGGIKKHHKVCTREQFEACAAKKGEKWTHTYNDEQCYIATTYNDCAWIVRRFRGDIIVDMDKLKPIKPTISEAEAIGILMVNKHLSFAALLEDYDVVKD